MPFTPNRAFKADPRMVVRAEGMHYYAPDGRAILDGTAGLWCCAAGHGRPRIVEGIQRAAAELDYATNFNLGHPAAFEFALLQHPQQLDLNRRRDFADFIEKQRASVGQLKAPFAAARGSGERTFFMAKEF